MAANKVDLTRWFQNGVRQGFARMIVWCDTYDYSDFPAYVNMTGEELRKYCLSENGHNMKRLMEVYDLEADMDAQLGEHRAFHY
jgi:hypothetical protein